MKNTLKIQARGIGKTSDTIALIKKLMKEDTEKNRLHIAADRKNHKAYIDVLSKNGIQTEIIEQTANYVVLVCKK